MQLQEDLVKNNMHLLNVIVIDYTVASPPNVETSAVDTIRYVQVEVYGDVDSTGSQDLDSVGLEYYYPDDNTDTVSVAKGGTFGTGAFSVLTDSVLVDTSLVVRVWGLNSAAKNFGAWDTLSTAVAGTGAALSVDGRTVNTAK